jgi:hypothetical protein
MACGAPAAEDADEETVGTATGAIGVGTMTVGEHLYTGQSLYSSNCAFRLQMEGSGRLVASYTNGGAFWSTNTPSAGAWAALQGDGNFVIYRSTGGRALWSTSTDASRLVMQNDRNVVLYDGSAAVWASNTRVVGSQSSCAALGGGRISEVTAVRGNTEYGGPGQQVYTATAAQCGNQCALQGGSCQAWTWYPGGSCALLSSVTGTFTRSGAQAGIKRTACSGNCSSVPPIGPAPITPGPCTDC